MVTVPRDVDQVDVYARYRRVVLSTTVVRKHGGTTVLSVKHIDTLAHQLLRARVDVISAIKRGFKCAVQERDDGAVLLRGVFSEDAIDDCIERMVLDDVLCAACGNPETARRGKSRVSCLACGHSRRRATRDS